MSIYMPSIPGANWAEGCIYYVLSGETGRIKIGFTDGDPVKRLRSFRTGSPTEIGIVAVHPGSRALEQKLHQQFANDRTHGEWFDVSDDMLIHLAGVISLTIAIFQAAGEKPPAWAITGEEAIRRICADAMEGDTLQ